MNNEQLIINNRQLFSSLITVNYSLTYTLGTRWERRVRSS